MDEIKEISDLRQEAENLYKQKRVTVVFTRFCHEPDAPGARKIITQNPAISLFRVVRKGYGSPNEEIFYTTDDDDFNKRSRAILLDYFVAGK